jgi:hypothetical protein
VRIQTLINLCCHLIVQVAVQLLNVATEEPAVLDGSLKEVAIFQTINKAVFFSSSCRLPCSC